MSLTILDAATATNVCVGQLPFGDAACPWRGTRRHLRGFIDVFGVVHYTDRRFTRRALRNMLLLVARRDREADPGYLNLPRYDWYYLWSDNVTANRMALDLGVRIPAFLSRLDRMRCIQSAERWNIRLSKRSAIYSWAHDA